MAHTTVHKDLIRERKQASFDPLLLTNILDGGVEKTKRRRYIVNLVLNDPEYINKKDLNFMDRIQTYDYIVQKSAYGVKRLQELNIDDDIEKNYFFRLFLLDSNNAFSLHRGMFMPCIKGQGTEEQKKKWLPLAENYAIIGTYAQTELGHGTFVRGLETTAIYDQATEEFILNTPTLTSMKWWPGTLAKTSNYAIVMAQLYTRGQCHGVQPFIVQIRNLDDHTLLPGVETGDIGPKLGYSTTDNGFLRLNNLRIPRDHMLMKYSKVNRDGSFIKPPHAKLQYGTMILVRVVIVTDAGYMLSKAATIGIRYSAIRRQSELKPGEEAQILDYTSQQYKLFPELAKAYAFKCIGREIYKMYLSTAGSPHGVDLSKLPELHALASCLKAFCTMEAKSGVEMIRLSCGGHGYSCASALVDILKNAAAASTYEGDHTILYMQTAKYLVKQAVKHATSLQKNIKGRVNTPQELIEAFEHRADRIIVQAAERFNVLSRPGRTWEDTANQVALCLLKASKVYAHSMVVKCFFDFSLNYEIDANVRKVLLRLSDLYAYCGIIENSGDFLVDGYLTSSDLEFVTNSVYRLLAEIRPDAVTLVDAFDFHDDTLGPMGRYDGRVYEEMYKWAKSSPLNEKDVQPAFYKYMKPMMMVGRSKL